MVPSFGIVLIEPSFVIAQSSRFMPLSAYQKPKFGSALSRAVVSPRMALRFSQEFERRFQVLERQ